MRGDCNRAARGSWHTASVTQIPAQVATVKEIAGFLAPIFQEP
jgi:hypothetical protein